MRIMTGLQKPNWEWRTLNAATKIEYSSLSRVVFDILSHSINQKALRNYRNGEVATADGLIEALVRNRKTRRRALAMRYRDRVATAMSAVFYAELSGDFFFYAFEIAPLLGKKLPFIKVPDSYCFETLECEYLRKTRKVETWRPDWRFLKKAPKYGDRICFADIPAIAEEIVGYHQEESAPGGGGYAFSKDLYLDYDRHREDINTHYRHSSGSKRDFVPEKISGKCSVLNLGPQGGRLPFGKEEAVFVVSVQILLEEGMKTEEVAPAVRQAYPEMRIPPRWLIGWESDDEEFGRRYEEYMLNESEEEQNVDIPF